VKSNYPPENGTLVSESDETEKWFCLTQGHDILYTASGETHLKICKKFAILVFDKKTKEHTKTVVKY